jgi:hypothetical protein
VADAGILTGVTTRVTVARVKLLFEALLGCYRIGISRSLIDPKPIFAIGMPKLVDSVGVDKIVRD